MIIWRVFILRFLSLIDDIGVETFKHQERIHEQICIERGFSEMNSLIFDLCTLIRALTDRITSNYYVSGRSIPILRREDGINAITSETCKHSRIC